MRTLLLVMLATTTAMANDPPRFPAPRFDLPGGSGQQVALADVDGDGVLDVGAPLWTHGWGLSRGRPDGSFGPVEENPSPIARYLAEFADVDGDGDLDAITGAYQFIPGLAGVQALLNDGDGHFTPSFSAITGKIPESFDPLAVADYDGNGMADIAVVRANGAASAEIVVFLASGGGNFTGPVSYAVTAGHSGVCEAGDLDGDGDVDLAVVLTSPQARVAAFLNQGNGSFVAGPVTPGFPFNPEWSFQLADVDDDGRLDAAFHEESAPVMHVLPGQGDGSFGADVVVNLPVVAASLKLSDIDGDGLPDAVVSSSKSVVTLRNLGGFGFVTQERLCVEEVTRVMVADLDIDGRLDILANNQHEACAAVLLQRTDGTHDSASRYATMGNLTGATAVDLDGDGRLDVVETHSVPPSVRVLLQEPDGSFDVLQDLPTASAPQALIGLLDADATPDLVVSSGTSFTVALGLGDGSFGALSSAVTGGSDLQLVDLTGDGELDLVGWYSFLGNKLRVMTGDGAGGFTGPTDWTSVTTMGEIGAVDLDGDGDIDIVAGSGSSIDGPLTKWINTGGGGMIQTAFVPVLTAPSSEFLFGDVNGDGDADMLAQPGMLCLGLPGSDFGAPVALPGPMLQGATALADLDGDGAAEIIVAEPSRAYLHVLQYGGSLSTSSCGRDAAALCVADMDGDGLSDIVTPTTDGFVTIVTQLPASPFSDLGHALAGTEGDPVLTGAGTLEPSTPVAFRITNAAPFSSASLIVGFSLLELPFKGGVLVPTPSLVLPPLPTNGVGKLVLGVTWPAAAPSGLPLYLQAWLPDAAGPAGFAATNGLRATTP